MLRGYAETDGCRRRYLLNYLGEEYEPPCGACDRCLATGADGAAPRTVTDAPADAPFRLNDRVRHVPHGAGLVTRLEGDRIVVAFDDGQWRTLDLALCLERGLLAPET